MDLDNIPVLTVYGDTLPEVWENSLTSLFNHGIQISTQYDKEGDPPSLDSTMLMVVKNPLFEPMIHKCLPCGLEDLQEYEMEVVDGIKDHWINEHSSTYWRYGYHKRIFDYNGFDQFEDVCNKLAKTPYTRRAQAVIWQVDIDNHYDECPCLQSLHFRIINNQLNMNVRFRSRDAFKAAFMNMFALVQLQKRAANYISRLRGEKITVGQYTDFSDSYHIYGKDLKEFKNRFIKSLSNRTFEQRTYKYCDVKDIMDDAIPHIINKVNNKDVN